MKGRFWTGLLAAIGMIFLILDAKTALLGAMDGVSLCLRSLIPSLLPFFLLSNLLTGALAGISIPILSPIGKLCGIPSGAEALLLAGFLGGYPTGAQGVAQAYEVGALKRDDAGRLLSFCSNAGPAFLFGIIGTKFSNMKIVWALWLIHILSALVVGMILPGKGEKQVRLQPGKPITVPQALQRSLKITATVCGWVILFRVLLAIFTRWIFWLIPAWLQVAMTGILELANGCCDLSSIPQEPLRYLVCSVILSLGGLCVLMQTASVTGSLGLGWYIPGKLLQSCFSFIFAWMTLPTLFGENQIASNWIPIIVGLLAIISIILLQKIKNRSSIPVVIGV